MAAERSHDLQPGAPHPLTLAQERVLAALIDECWPDDGECDVDRLAHAIERWAFDANLVYVPSDEKLRRDGLRFVPTSPWGTIAPVYYASVATSPATRPPAPRPPSLRELGADPIDRAAS